MNDTTKSPFSETLVAAISVAGLIGMVVAFIISLAATTAEIYLLALAVFIMSASGFFGGLAAHECIRNGNAVAE